MTNDNNHSGIISKAIPFIGWYCRVVVRIPLLGRTIGLSNRVLGWFLPKFSFLGFRNERSYENAVWNWENFLNLIGAQYDVEETSPQSRCYTIKKCPAGHCQPGHLNACKASMELDSSLVLNSGGRLIVNKRFPTDGVCVERVVPN